MGHSVLGTFSLDIQQYLKGLVAKHSFQSDFENFTFLKAKYTHIKMKTLNISIYNPSDKIYANSIFGIYSKNVY